MRARARAWRVRVRVFKLSRIIPYVMENKVGLYRMLIDASCAIFQNLTAVSDLMSDSAVKSAKESLREITGCAQSCLDEIFNNLFADKK